jgi:SAM-dependent methyltransferase
MMSDRTAPNAREMQYWNSPATRAWAEEYEWIDRLFAGVTHAVLAAAAPQPGERVIDIGCGSGSTVLALAARVGPTGRVLGADISNQSVAQANSRIAAAGLRQAEASVADVSIHAFAPDSFDLAFSRFGVMFFADPTATLANLRRGMTGNGRLAFAVFRTPKENPWATTPIAALGDLVPPQPKPGPDDPGQFSWADPALVHRILETAGFRDVSLTPHDLVMQLAGAGGATEAAEYSMYVGPVVRATLNAPDDVRAAVRAALLAFFKTHESASGVALPGAIWIVRARA